jgi:hypothetical protein
MPFTYAAFDAFCQSICAIPTFTLAAYLSLNDSTPELRLVLRFDVDYREAHAVRMAQVAHDRELRGTFYFRHHSSGFDLNAIRRVAALGHEVGYHFETLDLCGGDVDRAAELFLEHAAALHRAGFAVHTAAAHGAPPTASTYQSNRDVLVQRPDLLAQAGLMGEAVLNVEFARVVYVSDAYWGWHRYERPGRVGERVSLNEALALAQREQKNLYATFHPHQWFATPLAALFFRWRARAGSRVLPYFRR